MFAFSLCTIEIETIRVTGNYPLLTDQYEFINPGRKFTSFIFLQGFRRQRDQRAAERNIFKSVFLAGIVSERPTASLFFFHMTLLS